MIKTERMMNFFKTKFKSDIVDFNIRLKSLLKNYLKSWDKKFGQVLNYSLFPGGKRVRPVIMFAAGEMLGVKKSDLFIPATVIELIHNYSLIHDDLPAIDNDDYRRGKLTVHKKYNEATAILAGDALLTLAFELLSNQKNISSNKTVAVLKQVSNYVGGTGLILGQVLDINSSQCFHRGTLGSVSEQKKLLNKIHINKTAKLIELCVVIPGIIKGLGDKKLTLVHKIGQKIGLLFQITDDLLDFSSGRDKNKLTYPNFYGVEKTKKIIKKLANKTRALISKNFDNCQYLLFIIDLICEREK